MTQIWNKLNIPFLAWLLGGLASTFGLEFDIKYTGSIPDEILPKMQSGMEMAARIWEEKIVDDLVVQIEARWVPTFANPAEAGRASIYYMPTSYSSVRAKLIERATTAADLSAIEHLPESGIRMWINRTEDNPHGTGSATPWLDDNDDANNRQMRVSLTLARLLGLLPPDFDFIDGKVTISGRANWDYDPTDGIDPGKADFVAVCVHEIGHVLGMNSLLDSRLGRLTGHPSSFYAFVTPLDLFRYSRESAADGAIDWTVDDRNKYLSMDGGETGIANLATGYWGDRADPSHWARGDEISGIFEPAVYPGMKVTDADVLALDLMGWTPRVESALETKPEYQPEPEPEPTVPEPELARAAPAPEATEPDVSATEDTEPDDSAATAESPAPARSEEPTKELEITFARIGHAGVDIRWDRLEGYNRYRIMVMNEVGEPLSEGAKAPAQGEKRDSNFEVRFFYVEATP